MPFANSIGSSPEIAYRKIEKVAANHPQQCLAQSFLFISFVTSLPNNRWKRGRTVQLLFVGKNLGTHFSHASELKAVNNLQQ